MSDSINLNDYLDTDQVLVKSEIISKKKLLEEMAKVLSQRLPDAKEKDIYHCLLEREKLGNTGVGNGVALPHSRSELTKTAVIAIITLNDPIDYDSIDKKPIDVAFGLLVPTEATSEHLNLLASIAKIMSDNEKKVQLSSATTSQQAIQLITNWSKAI